MPSSTITVATPQSRWRDGVSLLRPPNLVTAAADSLAGGLIAGAHVRNLVLLASASVCLYAGGVVLNDVFDRRLDAIERPERPLPSGRVPVWFAAVAGALLLCAGVVIGLVISPLSGVIAGGIAAAVLAYDAIAKPSAAGPLVMGSCRALNLLLGLSVSVGALRSLSFLALVPLVYVAAITTLSRDEVHGGRRNMAQAVCAAMLVVTVSLVALPYARAAAWRSALPFALFLAMRILPSFLRAVESPRAEVIRAAVHVGIVSLITLDAALAAPSIGFVPAAALLSLSLLAAELAKFFAVT